MNTEKRNKACLKVFDYFLKTCGILHIQWSAQNIRKLLK